MHFAQTFHTRRELLVRVDVIYSTRRRRNAKGDQRPRLGGRVLGIRSAHVGHVHCEFGGISDGGKDASEPYIIIIIMFLDFMPIARAHIYTRAL